MVKNEHPIERCNGIFDMLCDEFVAELERAREEDKNLSPKALAEIRNFLKDNGVSANTMHGGLRAVAEAADGSRMPDFDDDGNVVEVA